MFPFSLAYVIVLVEASPFVETRFGQIRGHVATTTDQLLCDEFLGIPFAEPPQRFELAKPWQRSYGNRSFIADNYGPWCPQLDGDDPSGNEDCLFLNVWRPVGSARGGNMSMMVWIHGGSFVMGDAGDRVEPNTYNGCGLAARHGLVIASMNYRLGPLGFATFARPDGRLDTNFGIEDQRQALRWLRENAHTFGAESSKITIFGESAGAISVFHHIVSTKSAGLFRAAISESGVLSASSRQYSLNNTMSFAALLGCKNVGSYRACLLNKSVKELTQYCCNGSLTNSFHWGPTVDGIDLVDHPTALLLRNQTSVVPILAGTNTDEANAMLWPEFPDGLNSTQYHELLGRLLSSRTNFGLEAKQLAEVYLKYPASSSSNLLSVASSVLTDYGFLCGTRLALSSLSARGGKSYLYRFDHRPACPKADPSIPGTYHALELPYVFGTPGTYNCSFTAQESDLSTRVQKAFTNFAKYLAPTEDESFPELSGSKQTSKVYHGTSDDVEVRYRGEYCDFWFSIYEHVFRSQQGALDLIV
eukprot:TRINITY_DN58383_c0_g1_i1.p1 TRINITY_DN58383_c0_g1~~TRINITY_DN58383_c0_g1_i1.p1  ORF type:complete len:531 (+),score=57.76 TRINITY_DN58383_c0_g1_i1:47-1639(+)